MSTRTHKTGGRPPAALRRSSLRRNGRTRQPIKPLPELTRGCRIEIGNGERIWETRHLFSIPAAIEEFVQICRNYRESRRSMVISLYDSPKHFYMQDALAMCFICTKARDFRERFQIFVHLKNQESSCFQDDPDGMLASDLYLMANPMCLEPYAKHDD